MSKPNAWTRAFSLRDKPRQAAAALCSFNGWAEATDAEGRNVWMETLRWGGYEIWPWLVRKPDAWSAFGLPDKLGRTELDYMLCVPPPQTPLGDEWVQSVAEKLRKSSVAHPGLLLRALNFSASPLYWSPAPCPCPARDFWRHQVSALGWGIGLLSGAQTSALLSMDQHRAWGLWQWLAPAQLEPWLASVQPDHRWRWALWEAAANPSGWNEEFLMDAWEGGVEEEADRGLLPVVQSLLVHYPRPWLRAKAVNWGLPVRQKETGSSRSRF